MLQTECLRTNKWEIYYKKNGESVKKEFELVDNLYPDHFIQLLIPPSNYIGAKNLFETVLDETTPKLPLVLQVDDTGTAFPATVIDTENGEVRLPSAEEIENGEGQSPNKYDPFPSELPDSLQEAVQCFILSIAIRLSRKPEMVNSRFYNPHHTMLVHVSRFITWQNTTKKLLLEYLQFLESRILKDFPQNHNAIFRELEKTWNKYFASIVANIRSYLPQDYKDEFLSPKICSDIEPLLIESVKGIEIKAINSDTKDKLSYTKDSNGNGKKYIAIGGNRLSRGFTLEGLTINYFIRNTNYSDTQLQMGRWFGYRPGYIDCCKIFTTSDAIEKFDSTTRTIEELEADLVKMDREGKEPKDFLIKVLKDPGALKITRPSILKNTKEINLSYQDKLEQTTKFTLNPQLIEKSWTEFNSFVHKYKSKFYSKDDFYLFDTTPEVLFELMSLQNSFYKYGNDLSQIRKFIELCVTADKLKNWTIA